MSNPIKCCQKCEDRHIGCHSECERYKEERLEYDMKKEIKRKAKESRIDTFARFKYWR